MEGGGGVEGWVPEGVGLNELVGGFLLLRGGRGEGELPRVGGEWGVR